MLDPWLAWTISAALFAAGGLLLLARRHRPVVYANPREEQLTRTVARRVGCSPAEALPAVRREVEIAPGQSDETLIKRAAYHCRPESAEPFRPAYMDPVPG
jgi:hypothetical protein